MNWIKEHPYLVGILVVLVILYFILRSNASSNAAAASTTSSTGTSDTVAVAGLTANSQLQAAQISAQTQVAGYQAAVATTALQTAVQSQQVAASQNVDLQNILTSGAVATTQSNNQTQVALAQVGGAVQIAQAQYGQPSLAVTSPSTVLAEQANVAQSNQQIIDTLPQTSTNAGLPQSNPNYVVGGAGASGPGSLPSGLTYNDFITAAQQNANLPYNQPSANYTAVNQAQAGYAAYVQAQNAQLYASQAAMFGGTTETESGSNSTPKGSTNIYIPTGPSTLPGPGGPASGGVPVILG